MLTKRQLFMAWNTWRQAAADAKRDQEMLRRGLAMMMKRQMVMGWNTWREVAAELQRQQDMLRRGLAMLTKRQLFMAWNMWRTTVAEGLQKEELLMRGLSYFMKQLASKAWNTLREAGAKSDQDMVSMAMVHRLFELLLGAWNTWRDNAWQMGKVESFHLMYQDRSMALQDPAQSTARMLWKWRKWTKFVLD